MGGGFCGCPDAINRQLTWNGHPAGHPTSSRPTCHPPLSEADYIIACRINRNSVKWREENLYEKVSYNIDTGHYWDGDNSKLVGDKPDLLRVDQLNLSESGDDILSDLNVLWCKHTVRIEPKYIYDIRNNNLIIFF